MAADRERCLKSAPESAMADSVRYDNANSNNGSGPNEASSDRFYAFPADTVGD